MRRVYAPPPPVYVEAGVVVQDDYVYYPGYQVYYSSNRRQYIYLEGRSWVSRPAPPRVSVDVLFASPSVRLDFHDSPSIHHAAWEMFGSIRELESRLRISGIGGRDEGNS